MSNFLQSKSKTPLQLKVFHTLLGLAIFFSLITIPAECQRLSLFGIQVSSDSLWWPVVFFIAYLINSVYGFSYLRHSVYLIILFRLIYLLFLKLAICLPSSSFWKLQASYTHVLGRDFLYIIKSSFIMWFCLLIPLKLARYLPKKLEKLVFFSAIIVFSFLNFLSFKTEDTITINNLMVMLMIIGLLMIFSNTLINVISNIEQIKTSLSDDAIFKFKLPIDDSLRHKFFKYHHLLFCSSVVFFIASKTMASKFISIGFITINVGGIVFSLTYLVSDIMTDVYGIERTKQMILFVIFCNLLFVFNVWLTNALSITAQSDFSLVLHNQARMFFSSGIAFFLGMTINSTVISMIKSKQRRRGISLKKEFITTVWVRIATSSAFGMMLDVSLFSLVAFYGIVPADSLISIIIFENIYKIFYEVMLAPVSILLIYLLKIKEKTDIYDQVSNLNPFRVNTNYPYDANKFYENYSQLPPEKK